MVNFYNLLTWVEAFAAAHCQIQILLQQTILHFVKCQNFP